MEKLLIELKAKIIDTLCLTDVTPEDIEENEPLVGGVLGIDSIDILELVMMIEEDYSIRIANKDLAVKAFSSLKSLATYIHENLPNASN
ncbi:MAG: acyl carrier protein [Deltaproteobacteria bacterium]|nr:acyl carrier protein [Deltaproteobacteria bacterium]MBW1847831.1 acyl carrier protein [Deltaproteobacteria bacterium]MBW1985058.1 acyl carrier protein [Deltaproteobacteria bacterium]MBW2178969.1 acyl carrier protein [Deltaproteobacteria bacterium]MBW2365383.1 acyl carrier protein [Deltaproteobacteria bacterium]